MPEDPRSFLVPRQVPEGWRVGPLSQILRERRIKVSDEDFPPLSVTMDGIVPQRDHVAKTSDGSNRRGVRAGDLVINSRSDRKGAAGIAPLDGSVSLISIVMEPFGVESRFLHHLVRSTAFQEEFYRRGQGIVADLWTTRFPALKRIEVAVPPQSTQAQIADFLDRETTHIDALIEKKERLIRLLDEKRSALITHAVTKGLNPDAPMKDSGVEWIGEIPEHWEVSELRFLTPISAPITYGIVQAGPETEGGVPYIRTSDMSGHELPESGYGRTHPDIDRQYKRSRVREGDIVVAIRASVGKALRVPDFLDGANLTQGTARVRPGKRLRSEFLLFALQSGRVQSRMASLAKGATFREITLDMLRRVPIAVPPLEVQERITKALLNHLARMREATSATGRSISLLRERRSALITAAVTGQLDIPDYPS